MLSRSQPHNEERSYFQRKLRVDRLYGTKGKPCCGGGPLDDVQTSRYEQTARIRVLRLIAGVLIAGLVFTSAACGSATGDDAGSRGQPASFGASQTRPQA